MVNKFFKVTCKCGHVGSKYYIRISFPIIATCGKDAANVARYIPRVKHEHKDAILECNKISYEEYLDLQRVNKNDPYLKCECKQDQELIENFSSRIEKESRFLIKKKKTKRASVEYRLKKQSYILKEKWWDYQEDEEWNNGLFAY